MTITDTQVKTVIITQGISLLPATQGLITSKFGLARFDDSVLIPPTMTPLPEARGGKGIAYRRQRVETPHHYIYKSPLAQDSIIYVSSESTTTFVSDNKAYVQEIIQPQIQKIVKPKEFLYEGFCDISIISNAKEEYFDFLDTIRFDDTELFDEILLTENSKLWTMYNTISNSENMKIALDDNDCIVIIEA